MPSSNVSATASRGPGACQASSANGWRSPRRTRHCLRAIVTCSCFSPTENRIELPNRRAGRMGSFARGFFVGNSEVGKSSLFAGFFLFDYVCCNRIVWGADQYTEVRIRHTKGAPDRWLEEVAPVLKEYDEGSAQPVMLAIEAAREKRVQDDLEAFLAKRFGRSMVEPIKAIHQ